MDNMKSIFGLFVVSWFAFAFFELSFDREIFVSYTASEVADYDPDAGQPRLLPRAVTEYRVQQDSVVSRTGEYVSKYNDCTVFDSDNWTCTYSDESGTFGARRANSSAALTSKNSLILNTLMKKKPCLDFAISCFNADGTQRVASMQFSACSDHS
ncbi:hypothetical protein [uncultured Tateyamaria sp.]|uniref:hypothetical protein n=1 Tax=uncultured Tateyamaria sp. TaxID=455651 RepID=UPI00261A0747|nr:hypothetical protein [uncultured Tateyamaria sp.]